MIGLILRIYSYVYHLVLCLILLALGTIASIGNAHNLKLGMFPWKGAELTHWLLILGVAGLISIALAVTKIFKYLFPVWCLVVVVMMIRGFFLSPYAFNGSSEFRWIVFLVVGAIGALLASLMLLKKQKA